MPARPYP